MFLFMTDEAPDQKAILCLCHCNSSDSNDYYFIAKPKTCFRRGEEKIHKKTLQNKHRWFHSGRADDDSQFVPFNAHIISFTWIEWHHLFWVRSSQNQRDKQTSNNFYSYFRIVTAFKLIVFFFFFDFLVHKWRSSWLDLHDFELINMEQEKKLCWFWNRFL